MNEKRTIFCPVCGRLLTMADRNDEHEHLIACRDCNRLIKFVPLTGYRQILPMPQRTTSSGMTFY